jgi:hypothetical protein
MFSVRQLLGDEQPASNANAEVLIRILVSTALPFGIPEQVPVGRQTAPYSPEPELDIVLIEPQPRHRTPRAWMILCTLGDSIVALSGSIPLHGVPA